MKSSSRRFLFAVIPLTLMCGLLQLAWNRLASESMRLNDGFILLGVFAVVVTAVHFFLLNLSQNASNAFIRGFMASTVIKFMLYLTILIGFLLYSKDNPKVLVLHFLFYYAVFTVFEVSMLYREFSGKKSSRQPVADNQP